ncbi:HET-D [Lizonia empirigonia]|nr:HET-D [Lizonia empirigonia]
MRLLQYSGSGELSIHSFDDGDIPPYAILSHTWGADGDEVTFADLQTGNGKTKPGQEKILFCGKQAQRDNLQYFWIDTCCIDKANKAELAFSIRSMFRWYRNAARCYVYLSDVSIGSDVVRSERPPEFTFKESRWFTRGWTLQELLAPSTVEFFSKEGAKLGDKLSLAKELHEVTDIPCSALHGEPLSDFGVKERIMWIEHRTTKIPADRAYSLMGILGVSLSPIEGESLAEAMKRVEDEFDKQNKCFRDLCPSNPRHDKKRVEETKGGLLAGAYRWILDNNTFQQWQQEPESRLLWVKGDPGKGKTMLLCGIIDELPNLTPKPTLFSYFFCQATDSRINSATAVLRGLLYMLVDQQPSLAVHVRKKHDREGGSLFNDANAWVALTEIFAAVLRDTGLSTTYLIIDALDECTTDQLKLLRFIAEQSSASSRVKWIVSSRNWPAIEEQLERAEHKTRLSLELNAESVAAAVDVFIHQKVDHLAREKQYEEDLRHAVLQHFKSNANDTFLWVALVCQALKETDTWNVLERLTEFPPGLDSLYERMLPSEIEYRDANMCLRVLAVTAVLYRPVTVAELVVLTKQLARFANRLESVRKIIGLCGSFLTLRDDTVYFVHQSAKDFLVTKALNEVFPDGTDCVHQDIFAKSLTVLHETLHRDVYNLRAPGYPIGDVRPPLPDPLAVSRYPCVYWIDHFCDSKYNSLADSATNQEDTRTIDAFLRQKYLYWLEALSLCSSMARGIVSMTRLWHLVQVQPTQGLGDTDALTEIVYDARRFIMYHKEAVEKYPLQAYASALLFSPADSITRRLFQHEEPKEVTIKPAISNGWSACLQTLEGHSDYVSSVAFSHDSTWLASASGDSTVKIWDASSGTCLHTLEGHSRYVSSVAFSHDSTWLASASDDSTVKIWDASSGTCLHTLEGHSSSVSSVAFSHDSTWLASASDDSTVKIWDASSGTCLHTLEGHSRYVSSVAFSHDSTWLASASDDSTVKIWDASSGACLSTINVGTSLRYLSFDSTGTLIHTETGTITISTSQITDRVDVTASELQCQGAGLSPDGIWVMRSGSNILWMPSEYRPSCSVVSETHVGMGVGSGRVWLCQVA